MSKNIFDNTTRVPAEEFNKVEYKVWAPPVVDEAGHLVQAEKSDHDRGRSHDTQENQEGATENVSAEEVEKIRDNARQEGLDIGKQEGISQGKQEGINQGKQEGIDQGKEEGRKLGLEQGLADAKTQVDEKLLRLNKLLTNLTHAINEQDYKIEQALLNLITEIARAVVKRDLEINPEQIMAVVKEAVAVLPPTRDNIRIFVNPNELDLVKEAAEQGGENWRIFADESLTVGGCRVETEQSVVDFTTDTRFKTMIDQILAKQLSLPQEIDLEEAPEPVVKPFTEEPENTEEESLEAQAHALQEPSAGREPSATEGKEPSAITTPAQQPQGGESQP